MRLVGLIALLLWSPVILAGPAVGVAAVAGIGAATGAATVALAFQYFVTNFAITYLLTTAARRLQKSPGTGTEGFRAQSQNVTVRSPNAPRQMILGRTRTGGVVTYMEVTGAREFLHLVITLSAHEIDAIEQIWFDDEVLSLDGSGNAQGQFLLQDVSAFVQNDTVPASGPYQVTVSQTISTLISVFDQTPPIFLGRSGHFQPPTIRLTDVSPAAPASMTEFSRSGSVFTFHASMASRPILISYQAVTGARSLARVLTRTGAPSDTVFAELVAESGGKWTANHLQTGCAKLYVRLRKSATVRTPTIPGPAGINFGQDNRVERFLTGVPNITVVARGAKAYDPRTGLTTWTRNPALLLNWYLTLPKLEGGVGLDYATEISESHLIAAANICDEAVDLAGGGTEPRYQCDGSFTTDLRPSEAIKMILSAMAGDLVKIGATWRIYAGAYVTPTETLDESECRANMRIQTLISRRDLFNRVKGTYISPGNNWQPADFPAVTNATYLAEDDGDELFNDVELPMTTAASAAQRLAKIELEQVRQQIVVDYPGQLSVFRVQPPETIMLNNTRMGWVNKPFKVVKGSFSIYDDANGNPALGYDLQLRETASTIYDWNLGEETTVDPAPNTNLPNPFDVPVPSLPTATEELYQTTGNVGVRSRVAVVVGVSDPSAVTAFQFEYKNAGVANWIVLPPVTAAQVLIDDLQAGYYDFRARCIGLLGSQGDYSEILVKEVLGLTAPPEDVMNFSVQAIAGQAQVTLDRSTDLDVSIGGRLILRWSPLTSGATWNNGSLLSANGYPGDSESFNVPLLGGTYLAKFRDSTGHYSINAASFTLTEALLTGFTTDFTVTEQPAFTGSKTNVAAVDSGIQLVGATLIDDMGLIDSQDNIDSLGGIVPSGSYDFASKGDLGSVKTVRLFPMVKSLAFDTVDLWDSRTDPIDSWGLVDGGVIEDAEATLMVRITDDDPNSGSPTWGAWHALHGPADYTARGFDFRLDFTSGNVTHNRTVTELSVAAKTPV